jgi:hypothetical protein
LTKIFFLPIFVVPRYRILWYYEIAFTD